MANLSVKMLCLSGGECACLEQTQTTTELLRSNKVRVGFLVLVLLLNISRLCMSQDEIDLFNRMKDAFKHWSTMDEQFFFDNPGYMLDEIEGFAEQIQNVEDK